MRGDHEKEKKSRFTEQQIVAVLKEVEADEWLIKYNSKRPHESLGNLTPWQFSEKLRLSTEVLH